MSEPYNKTLLAKQAKRALRALNETPNKNHPYLLQLMRTALNDKSLCPVSLQTRADLLEALDVLDGNPTLGAQLINEGPNPNEETYSPPANNLPIPELIEEITERLVFSLSSLDALPKRSTS